MWEPTRVEAVSSVLNRYAAHLRPGHRVRLGIEGDPCSPYRSVDEAPRGVVETVDRDGDRVRFTIQTADGQRLALGNHSVSPEDVWEVDPDDLDRFRGDVIADLEPEAAAETAAEASPAAARAVSPAASLRHTLHGEVGLSSGDASVAQELSDLHERFRSAEEEHKAFRGAVMETIRQIASDLIKTSRGDKLEFASEYADRYDLATTGGKDDFRGVTQTRQSEKFDFRGDENGTDLSEP